MPDAKAKLKKVVYKIKQLILFFLKDGAIYNCKTCRDNRKRTNLALWVIYEWMETRMKTTVMLVAN